jgi:phosphopantetheine adenylyltransferase
LVLVYTSGEAEILNLADQENHDVLVEITGEIMLQLKSIINSYKSRIEKRVKFLMSITKDLQKIAEVFSEK